MPSTEAVSPRSLADELRSRSDSGLEALLRARPDLLTPVPVDVGALAARAASLPSVARALERVDELVLQTAEVLALLPEPTDAVAVARLLGASAGRPLDVLRELALLYGADDELRLVRTVRDLLGPAVAGLGPPLLTVLADVPPLRLQDALAALGVPTTADPPSAAAALVALLADHARADAVLAPAPPGVLDLLRRLTWGPPVGELPSAPRLVHPDDARTPVEWLLSRCLLGASGAQVVLPREVGLHLRGGRVYASVREEPPPLDITKRPAGAADRTAGGQAFTTIRHVEELLEAWGVDGPAVLRSGGLGVRELRRTATSLDIDEATAGWLAELAYAGGLLGPSGEIDDRWLPTPAYDAWRIEPPTRRWFTLASAWLETTRVAALAGGRDDRDRTVPVLGPDLDRAVAPDVRREVLLELAELPPGTSPTAASVAERLRWRHPRRAGIRRDLVGWTLAEAELLGVTGGGALSRPGRELLRGDASAAVAALAPLLPEPLEHVMLQADLTAVAPGPLTAWLASELALMADIESRGSATVYRFSPGSVRRALDAGRSASELHGLLAEHSSTPVPQPLTYLVDDVARRHGRVRVGTAASYVRCDDEGVLAELLAHKRTGQLGLRRLAPTVLAAQSPVDAVLARLRELGYTPAAETPTGDVLVRRPDSRRTPSRMRPPRLVTEQAPTPGLLSAAVRALRAGDRVRTARGDDLTPVSLPRLTPAETLGSLREAVRDGSRLWIGYVNAEGRATQRVIDPISVDGGYVRAFDHLREELRTFAVHRITGVRVAEVADEGS